MKRPLTILAVWVALLIGTILVVDVIALLLRADLNPETGAPRLMSSTQYATRFLLEAVVFSLAGVIAAHCVRSAPHSGLFALSLGVAYVIYVEWSSALWYYMTAHSTRIDQFFFTAPVLAPVIFPTAACLIWRIIAKEPSSHAL